MTPTPAMGRTWYDPDHSSGRNLRAVPMGSSRGVWTMISVATFVLGWFFAVALILWFFHNAIGDEHDMDEDAMQ